MSLILGHELLSQSVISLIVGQEMFCQYNVTDCRSGIVVSRSSISLIVG